MNFWQYMFLPSHQPWYTGAVWGNILQGLLFLVPSVTLILWRIEKHHKEHMNAVYRMKEAKKK